MPLSAARMVPAFASGWSWPSGPGLRYCLKAALATALGYALSWGGPESAVYGAMSAALIVGGSRGEDIASSANRVRGTLAGMAAGVLLVFAAKLAFLPAILAASLGIGLTAYVCLAFGWGVPAARVGAALCAVMVLAHGGDALGYSAVRVGNTLIGIASGLVVSHFVLTITAKEAVARSVRESLLAVADMLDAIATTDEPLPLTLHQAMLHRVVELEKAVRDGAREFHAARKAGGDVVADARQVGAACAGALTAALAHSDLCKNGEMLAMAGALQKEATRLAVRARNQASGCEAAIAGHEALAAVPPPTSAPYSAPGDETALKGLELGLRKIDAALRALGL